jgi:hypothetical protein
MYFGERTLRDAQGATVVQSRLRSALGRLDFERFLFPSIEVGFLGWQRSHRHGKGMGFESPHATRYAPEEVNQKFQRLGLERYLRELVESKPDDTELWLTTVTEIHHGTLRLKKIEYRVDAAKNGFSRRLFEARIEVADRRLHPRVTLQATPFLRAF